ncbi:MAG: zf-HC2 domain-containing protein [bacterium]|nr:zf-HC2 domain-containing protein [bacterium]
MRCSDVKSDLPLYSDDILNVSERADLDAHLDTCPLCRQALTEYQEVKNGLRSLARPTMPEAFLASLRSAVAAELAPAFRIPVFHLIEDRRNWLDTWLMPSAMGTFASVVFGMFMLWGILSSARDPGDFISISPAPRPVMLASSNPMIGDESIDILAADYATTRLSVASESPSVNPQGALVALTKSLVRGEMRDDEVVVVAEVFGNGLARISEVVEPGNSRAIEDLEKALESDPVYAPFVPASFDGRSERMRVVLKIQNVNVHTTARRDLPDRRGT